MKKSISLLLVALLIVTSIATVAFAAGSTKLTIGSADAKAGETVTLEVKVDGDDFGSFGMKIKAEGLTIGEMTPVLKDVVVNNGTAGFASSGSVEGKQTLFTIDIIVPEDVKPGNYPVVIDLDFIADEAFEDLNVEVVNGVISIGCDHAWGEWVVTTPATCEAEGVETATCSICGATKTQAIAALGHKEGEYKLTHEAENCQDHDVFTAECVNGCGKTWTKLGDAGDHVWGEWTYDDAKDKAAHYRYCSVEKCGESEKEAHKMKWGEVVEPVHGKGCDGKNKDKDVVCVDGHQDGECTVCGKTSTVVIKAGCGPVPPTGDISGVVTTSISALVIVLFSAVAIVIKRKTAI